MLASAIITFREVFEAALVVIIVLSYLKKSDQLQYVKSVWAGVGVGVVLSVGLALLFESLLGGLSGSTEKIVEGIMMLSAVLFITWMVVWIFSSRNVSAELVTKAERAATAGSSIGILLLITVAVLREGMETAVFLNAASTAGGASLTGAFAGVCAALVLAGMVVKGANRINIKTFFTATTVLLVLFAAGLTSHALLEFQQAGIISPVVDHLYDISWLIDKSSTLGSFFNLLFGYTGRPSLVEFGGYISYLLLSYLLYRSMHRFYTPGKSA